MQMKVNYAIYPWTAKRIQLRMIIYVSIKLTVYKILLFIAHNKNGIKAAYRQSGCKQYKIEANQTWRFSRYTDRKT